jgi:dihydrofolate synthase/folylpolyglutamate synthase
MDSRRYADAVDYWYRRINYEQIAPGPDDLKLDRMRALLHHIGDPQDRLRIVHVAGSKGKGSTAALLGAVLQKAGYRTGLFTSPHLQRVEERFQVDGVPATQEELTALLEEIRAAEAGLSSPCTFFEICTALGFLHFTRRRVQAAVVEVGLGGRFDSTNVCRPLLAIITSISRDHVKQLGDRLDQIAMEKAGIVKPGRPTVSGVTAPEARPVIERICRERGSPLHERDRDFHYVARPGRATNAGVEWPTVTVTTRLRTWPAMAVGLLGEHQAANAATAVAAVEVLRTRGFQLSDEAVAAGLAAVRWPARLEVMSTRSLVVLDCAHTVASAEALVAALRESFPAGPRHLIFAASSDKDVAGMLRILAPTFDRITLTRYTASQRSADPAPLAELVRSLGVACEVVASPAAAWERARAAAGAEELICVTGSVFLAGELRPLLLGDGK